MKLFSKYQKLLELLRARKGELGWTGKSDDRMVIFTERIDTLDFLRDNLIRDMKIKATQVETLHGGMSDIEQQRIVEAFGNDSSKIRLLIASDVASEGINLHYLSHKMIHFDIPWSLMAFQQRNGRIDRYGQEQEPHIAYLTTECNNAKIKGDLRVLELLIEKETKPSREELKQRALSIVGKYHDIEGAADVSINHDKYLAEIYAYTKEVENDSALQAEIWRWFLIISFCFLIVESFMLTPKKEDL